MQVTNGNHVIPPSTRTLPWDHHLIQRLEFSRVYSLLPGLSEGEGKKVVVSTLTKAVVYKKCCEVVDYFSTITVC